MNKGNNRNLPYQRIPINKYKSNEKKSPLEHYNNTSSRQNSLMSKLVDKTLRINIIFA